MRNTVLLFLLITSLNSFSQEKWYVSIKDGKDNLSGDNGTSPDRPLKTINYAIKTAWNPGDTIFVMNGTYQNPGYGTGNLTNAAVVDFGIDDIHSNPKGWLVIKNYPNHTPRIQFDGAGGFVGKANYIEISGLEIEGPNQRITHEKALADRLLHHSYFSGRGIAIWEGHHIKIHNNKVHDCPNSGIRINRADYCDISHNEVYNNTLWSSNAESAIVMAQSKDFDTKDTIKMIMTNNVVYNNMNKIPFYNNNINPGGPKCYGMECQDYIIDGQGVYITRNSDTYFYGWFYFANNVTYGNGINGLVVNHTNKAIVTNNTAYMNGATPPGSGRQKSSGITINEANNVKLYNNISWPRYSDDYGYQLYGRVTNLQASNNILVGGLSSLSDNQFKSINSNPMFVDPLNNNFKPVADSPAIDAGILNKYTPTHDISGNHRDSIPDIGAYE